MYGMQNLHRSSVATLRRTLAALGAVVAEVDGHLRYVWIDNAHPDFDPESVVGKRDDQLIPNADAEQIMALKRATFAEEAPVSAILAFTRSNGVCYYSLFAYPILGGHGKTEAILTVAFEMPPPGTLGVNGHTPPRPSAV